MYSKLSRMSIVVCVFFCICFLTLSPPVLAQKSISATDAAGTALPEGGIRVDCEFRGCDFNGLFDLANKIIRVIIWFALLGLTMVIIYAGTRLALNAFLAETPKPQVDKSKTMIRVSVMGLLLTLGAWLIVDTIFKTLEYEKDNPFEFRESDLELQRGHPGGG